MTSIVEHHVFIDSRQRSIGRPDEFTVWLKKPIMKTHPSHYFTARVVSAELPYTWQQVNSTNNTLPISVFYAGNTYSSSLTMAPGNYNINQLLTELKTKLVSTVQSLTGQTIVVNTSYSQSTNLISVFLASLPVVQVTIRFSANTFLASMFGCLADKTMSNTAGFGGDRNVNVNPVNSIFIRSELFRQADSYEAIVVPWDVSDILCKIQVQTPPNTILFYSGDLMLENRIVNDVIDRVSVYLSDNQSYALDLNGNDWSFRISFREVRPIDIETTESYMLTKSIDLKKPLTRPNQDEEDAKD